MGFTSSKAITATAVALASAIIGIVVAAGLPLSKELTTAIITFITVATPVAVAAFAFLHHNHAKIAAARVLAESGNAAQAKVGL